MSNKRNKQTSFDKELLEEAKSETFDSAFYFDDIIKELSDAGFYSEDDDLKTDESSIGDSKSLELDNKDSETLQNISENFVQQPVLPLDKDVVKKIFDIENKILRTNNNLKAEISDLKDIILKQKSENDHNIKELENKLLLTKNNVEHSFELLTNNFEKKIAHDVVKDKALDKLYEQMDGYKQNFIQNALKPFVKDLILFYDRINNNIKYLSDDQAEEKFISTITMFRDELLEIFNRNNIEPMEKSEAGSRFNPEKCKVISKIETDREGDNLTIKDVLQEGFVQDGKVLRPELVAIYKYKKV